MSVAQGIRLHPHPQAFASLRTHLLRSRRMLDTSYGICHRCRADIPLPRLRAQPDATLCFTCKQLSEERASVRRAAWRPDTSAEAVYRS